MNINFLKERERVNLKNHQLERVYFISTKHERERIKFFS